MKGINKTLFWVDGKFFGDVEFPVVRVYQGELVTLKKAESVKGKEVVEAVVTKVILDFVIGTMIVETVETQESKNEYS